MDEKQLKKANDAFTTLNKRVGREGLQDSTYGLLVDFGRTLEAEDQEAATSEFICCKPTSPRFQLSFLAILAPYFLILSVTNAHRRTRPIGTTRLGTE